jgi:hypothetical protein
MNNYFYNWHLKPNPVKSEVCAFHLNNREARKKLKVMFKREQMKNDFTPKYLGITLDRTLTFNEHLDRTMKEVRPRVNLIQKLTGTGWGADAKTLRMAALALTYSTTEYGAQVWCTSAHVKKVDTQLHKLMRVISWTMKSTQLQWLTVLTNIVPPDLRRKEKLIKIIKKVEDKKSSLLSEILEDTPTLRLKSKKPPWKIARDLIKSGFEMSKFWRDQWTQSNIPNNNLVLDPNQGVMGLELPRKNGLNRLCTGHGCCADIMHQRRLRYSPTYDCGTLKQ